jgi:hypothetical protein
MKTLAQYRKTIVAVIGAVLTWVAVAYVPDGSISREEWFALAVALATALGVYGISNDDPPVPEPVAEVPAPPVEEPPAG